MTWRMIGIALLPIILFWSLPTAAQKQASSYWPSFRGDHAAGVADGQNLPPQWDGEKGTNIKWKTRIPGLAHSSPVVWGDTIFVTTAISSRESATFKKGLLSGGPFLLNAECRMQN